MFLCCACLSLVSCIPNIASVFRLSILGCHLLFSLTFIYLIILCRLASSYAYRFIVVVFLASVCVHMFILHLMANFYVNGVIICRVCSCYVHRLVSCWLTSYANRFILCHLVYLMSASYFVRSHV